MIVVHLVRHDDPLSAAIMLRTGGLYAHAEALTPKGDIIGAFAIGGVQRRPLDYSGKILAEVWVALEADAVMSAAFYHYLEACIGEPYAFTDIADFELPFDLPHQHAVFCSALIEDALRGCLYFPRPLPIPAKHVHPTLLHHVLFARPDIKIITRDDPIFQQHIKGDLA